MVAAVPLAALLFALPACSQGDRKALADQVAQSVSGARGEALTGKMVVTVRTAHLPGGRSVTGMPGQMGGGTLASLGVLLDAKARRAVLLGPGDRPVVTYDPTTIYARRITKSPADKRLWSRLELHRLPDISPPTFDDVTKGIQPGDAVVVGPVLLSDLLAGVLTGSVHQRRVDSEGNRLITFNTSISKANRKHHLKDDDRKARKKLFRSLAIKDDISAGQVILGKDGTLREARFVFAERPDKQTRLDLEVVLTVSPLGHPFTTELAAPAIGTTVRVSAIGSIRATISDQLRQSAPPAGATR